MSKARHGAQIRTNGVDAGWVAGIPGNPTIHPEGSLMTTEEAYAHAFRFAFGNHPDAIRAFEYQRAAAERFGQQWSDKHANAFRELHQAYVLTAMGLCGHRRTAWPLAVGTGKTQSIVAFCKVQSENKSPLSLMVCMERVVQMRDLYADLLAAGVPPELIAVHHSKSAKDVEAEGLPVSTVLGEVDRFPYLLVTHSMMLRGETNIASVNRFNGKERQLTLWDESLIKSQGYHFDLASMETAVAAFRIASRDTESELKGDAMEACEALGVYLQALRDKFESQNRAPISYIESVRHGTGELSEVDQLVPVASWPEGAITRYESAVNAVMRTKGATLGLRQLLGELFDYTLRPVRVIPYREKGFRAGVIYYQPRIPESLSRLIVLDASHTIRLLTSKHDTTLHTTKVDCAVKTFDAVHVHCIQHGAGKDSLAKALRSKKSVVLLELVDRVRAVPEGEAVLIVTFKDERRESGSDVTPYTSLIKAALRSAGIYTEACLADGRSRFRFITWGQHLGVCGFSYCKHLFAVGVTRRQSLDIAAAITGQNANLNSRYASDLEEVSRVERSEMFHNLVQFAGRGSCRNTIDGRAESMNLTVICNDTFPVEMWQTAMPGVVVSEARSDYDTQFARANATTEAIRRGFAEVRGVESYVSAKTLKVLAGCTAMPAKKFSEVLSKVRKKGIEGWTYQKSRRGFTRCPFPVI